MIERCIDPEMNIIRLSVKEKVFPLCIFRHEKWNDFFSIQSTLNMEVSNIHSCTLFPFFFLDSPFEIIRGTLMK